MIRALTSREKNSGENSTSTLEPRPVFSGAGPEKRRYRPGFVRTSSGAESSITIRQTALSSAGLIESLIFRGSTAISWDRPRGVVRGKLSCLSLRPTGGPDAGLDKPCCGAVDVDDEAGRTAGSTAAGSLLGACDNGPGLSACRAARSRASGGCSADEGTSAGLSIRLSCGGCCTAEGPGATVGSDKPCGAAGLGTCERVGTVGTMPDGPSSLPLRPDDEPAPLGGVVNSVCSPNCPSET